jgi:hypothetical protein
LLLVGYDDLFGLFEACWLGKIPLVQKFYVEIEKKADTGYIRGPILQTMAIIACLRGHATVLRFVMPRAKELTVWSEFATSNLIKYASLIGKHGSIWTVFFEEHTIWRSSLSFTWRQQLNQTALLAKGKQAVELFTILRKHGAFFVTAFQLQDAIRDNQIDEKTVKFIVPTLCPALLNLSCGLHLVASRGNLSLMKVFLDCGADPNFIPDVDDKPEPDWAHPWGWDHIDLEPWRLSRAIPVGSALHATVGSDELLPATKLLLKRGASLCMRDDAGLNPLQKAVYTGATKTVKLLEAVEDEPEGLEAIVKGVGDGVGKMVRGIGKVFKDDDEWKAKSLPEGWSNGF